jgi:hypothetical protein
MAKACKAQSSGRFVAEMVEAVCSDKPEMFSAFVGRVMGRMQEQLTLSFEQANAAQRKALAGRKRPLARSTGRQRARPT